MSMGRPVVPMPWVDRQPLHPRFLHRLAQGRARQILRRLVMAARLQPASEGAVMDEQDPLPFAVEDERGRGHMAGKGAAGMDVVPARDLTAQKRVPLSRHAEGFRMPVEDRCDMAAEGGRIEAGRRDVQGRQPSITLAKASL